jgi:hypothetical protein
MEHVIVMGIAIIQLDYAFAMVTLREMIVHVSNNTYSPFILYRIIILCNYLFNKFYST